MQYTELEQKTIDELRDLAREVEIPEPDAMKRQEPIFRLLQALAFQATPVPSPRRPPRPASAAGLTPGAPRTGDPAPAAPTTTGTRGTQRDTQARGARERRAPRSGTATAARAHAEREREGEERGASGSGSAERERRARARPGGRAPRAVPHRRAGDHGQRARLPAPRPALDARPGRHLRLPTQIRRVGLRTGRPGGRANPAPQGLGELLQPAAGGHRQRQGPGSAKRRPWFDDLTAVFPDEAFDLELRSARRRRRARELAQANLSNRVLNLFSPMGKGQRGLVVSPPKAGKTMLLKGIAYGITTNYPDVHVMVALIGERRRR